MVLPDLFRDVVDPSVKVGERSFRSLPVSILLHGILVLAVVVVALTAVDVLPPPPVMLAFVAPVAAAPPPPPPPPAPVSVTPQPVTPAVNPAAAPVTAPTEIKPETGIEPTAQASGAPGGVEGGIPGGVVGEGLVAAPEPPPPPPPRAPIRVGGSVRPPIKIKDVVPDYPPLAAAARVQGVVIVEAEIGADGKVKDARILRSIPLLDRAALDAVRQWEYAPTLLNGMPAPILMVVTVNFFLTMPGAGVR